MIGKPVLHYVKARPVLAIIAGLLFAGSAAAHGANPFAFFFGGAPQESRSAYAPAPAYARPRPSREIRFCPDIPMSLDACGAHTLGLSITNSPAPSGACICGRLSIRTPTRGNLRKKSWQRLKR